MGVAVSVRRGVGFLDQKFQAEIGSRITKVHSRSVDPQKNSRNYLITRSI